jgi:anti-anti-sigma factor
VAPLVNGGRVVGALTWVTSESERSFDDADLALAGELGQRIATMVASEQVSARERQLHTITVALSAAGTVAEAAAELSTGIQRALGASVVVACTVGEDGQLHLVHALGYPADQLDRFRTMRPSAPLPITEAARTGRPVWLPDREAWPQGYPVAADALLDRTQAGVALPLRVGGRVVGAVGASFPTRRDFGPEERTFLLTLAGQAAVAFERAALADVRREVADTLQHSLLPRSLPAVDQLSVTARYLPGVHGTQAGGDWYDLLPLDGRGVAVVVGDVVGNGAPAAAVMGQLRSALAAVLLEGHSPARALDLLDRYAARVLGAQVSTVACLLLDPATGTLTYSRAGHPPTLVLDDRGARFLDGGWGPALGLPAPVPRTETTVTLPPGATLVLFTDGLVERRGESLDDGLDHLASAGEALIGSRPAALVDGLLGALVGGAGPADDIVVVATRLLPGPLRLELPAEPQRLAAVRRELATWAMAATADPTTIADLQLAAGEAVANAVEHAYRDAEVVGRAWLEVVAGPGEDITVCVRDTGRWRPAPIDPGFRGRGLQIIERLAEEVDVGYGPNGTTLRFRLARPERRPVEPGAHRQAPSDVRPAAVRVLEDDGRRRVEVSGDLDLDGVAAVRDTLLGAVGDGPVTLDLTGVGHLASVGMGLLLEVSSRADERSGPLEVELPTEGPARRVLELTGLGGVLTDPDRRRLAAPPPAAGGQ